MDGDTDHSSEYAVRVGVTTPGLTPRLSLFLLAREPGNEVRSDWMVVL